MSVTFSILDESTAGHRHDAGLFACDSDVTTLREIIRVRVKQGGTVSIERTLPLPTCWSNLKSPSVF